MPETTTPTSLTVSIINHILAATFDTFDMMMDVKCRKTGLSLLSPETQFYSISAVISLTGKAGGTLCLSFDQATAFETVRRLVDIEVNEVDGLVCDTVGEFANMIAGSAKDKIAEMELKLGIPNIVRGENHRVEFPSVCQPMVLDFSSDIGPFRIIFGFVEK